MDNGNGTGRPATRADIGMRLVVAAPNYGRIGILMDEIGEAVERVLAGYHATAEFDFTHFNTYPCKTARMEQIAYQMRSGEEMDVSAEPDLPPVPDHHLDHLTRR